MKSVVVIIALVLSSAAAAAKSNSVSCRKPELSSQDCHLKLDKYKLQFRSNKVHLYDGVWRAIEDMPVIGKKVEWVGIHFKKLAGRYFVEYYLWEDPKGEGQVQSLHWVVHEITGVHLKPHLDKVVQKRKELKSGKGKFNLDKRIQSSIKLGKDGKPTWVYGAKSAKL